MKLYLYEIQDAENVINKTLSNGLEIDINLKRDVNISRPEIFLQSIENVDFQNYNYAHIPELKRYYFINDIVSLNSKLWQLSFICDVLETYKQDIKQSYARFKRNIKNGDFQTVNIDYSAKTISTQYLSNGDPMTGSTMIISTIGG